MQLRQIARLDEWYRFDEAGPLFITGLQALVRLLLAQSHRDRLAGLNTAGFVSGYRGSPLGGFDRELWRAAQAPRRRADSLSAGLERGPRGHLDLGRAASEPVRRRALRRRVRHVVRQRARRRPLRRSVQARQRGRNVAPRRRDRRRRRRSHLQVVVAAASERVRVHRRVDAGAEPGQRRGDRRARSLRLRAVAVQRLLGRAQGHARDGRRDAELRVVAASARDRDAGLRAAARRLEHPLAGSAERSGTSAAALQAAGRARVRACERARPHDHRQPLSAARARDDGQSAPRRAASARGSRHRCARAPPRSASSCSRSA